MRLVENISLGKCLKFAHSYLVVVKVGKPSERSKPGNRGKRDSQVLLMHYLNRVHFDTPMNPLELEIYHQMRNVIGIDPAFYEYIFMVDADTVRTIQCASIWLILFQSVMPDSLNRLVACTADDSRIIAICGETKLDNEQGSWWTMIQVCAARQTRIVFSIQGGIRVLHLAPLVEGV